MVLGLIHMSKNLEIRKPTVFGSPKVKSESYLSQMEQNNSMELLAPSFLKMYSQNSPPDPPRPQIRILPVFPLSILYFSVALFFDFPMLRNVRTRVFYPERRPDNLGSQRDHQCSLRDHQYGCRGGNRFKKGGFRNLTKNIN